LAEHAARQADAVLMVTPEYNHGVPGLSQKDRNCQAILILDGPWWREAAGGHSCQLNREMDDCRYYAADQKAKYDDDDRFRDWGPH
jgi:hypothetical protein